MLVSIAVIAILFDMAVGVTSFVKTKIARSSTQATLKLIEMAFQKYKNEFGMYPHQSTTEPQELYLPNQLSTSTLKENLWGFFNDVTLDSSNSKIRGISLKFENNKFYIVDGWGHRILYICPGVFNTESFDLLSKGSDGTFDNSGTSRSAIGGWNIGSISDDITNFTRN